MNTTARMRGSLGRGIGRVAITRTWALAAITAAATLAMPTRARHPPSWSQAPLALPQGSWEGLLVQPGELQPAPSPAWSSTPGTRARAAPSRHYRRSFRRSSSDGREGCDALHLDTIGYKFRDVSLRNIRGSCFHMMYNTV